MNSFSFTGRLGKDAEKRYMPDGTAALTFSVATDETWIDKAGQRQKRTDWHRCQMFGKRAEGVAQYLTKGREVGVVGRVRNEEWTGRDGTKQRGYSVRVEDLSLIGGQGRGQRDDHDALPDTPAENQPFVATDEDVPF